MRTHHTITLLTAAGILALTACDPKPAAPASSDPKPATSAAAPSNPAAPPAKSKTAALPNLVGKGLQTAQDEAQAAGFYALKSHDSLGRDRLQVLDRDWKVCSQTPAAGAAVETSTAIDLGAVKLDETCPASDVTVPKPAGDTMPNFV
ncbi:PASTA domain-containing protein, partial [Streptomyces sp. NPDC085929]|uniref:PASTA domain-containing protein n=2 Tax=unclassified Streptomyces TaxID=2593676 RepID=UPI0037CD8540